MPSKVKLRQVYLSDKHIRELVAKIVPPDDMPPTFWTWQHFEDAQGREYAMVEHGREKMWYEVHRLVPDETNVDTLKEPISEQHNHHPRATRRRR
jgi:hypothetical protein